MRIKRQKRVNKLINFYCNNFGFRKPFQLLIDGTFCHAALKSKFNIQDQLEKYFQGSIKLLTTQCVILETEKLGAAVYGAMLIVKQFAVHKCGHESNPIPAASCLESMIGCDNPNRYILATQDRELQMVSERVAGVPILFIYQKAPTFQELSRITKKVAEDRQRSGFMPTGDEKKGLKAMRRAILGPRPPNLPFRKKKKKKGGPNPLSCKKKKVKPQPQPQRKKKSKQVSE
ncbi:hypothetical protein AAG570_001759 [Ranatra chinensis]|uniref:rRNA-processing protein UTP23 homolog n=1 Tax=Ranatra chinensis TaxID=642074 RepID=A0ABD0YXQ5_9HEMI